MASVPGAIVPAARPASLLVINPSGNQKTVVLHPLPFSIGRQADNNLVLRDNRASRNHARIVAEKGDYFLEDLKSSHGVIVNGGAVMRHRLVNGDRIEFGVPDSYALIFSYDGSGVNRLLDHFAIAANAGKGDLSKLRALVEVARAMRNSLSPDDVLAAVVDAALSVTGSERGFLFLRRNDGLDIRIARDRNGQALSKSGLDIPVKRSRTRFARAESC